MKKKIAAILILLAPITAYAGYVSGNDLHDSLLAFERFQSGRNLTNDGNEVIKLTGYLMGTADSWNGISFCTTPGVTVGQIANITRKHMESMPENWNQPAAYLVVDALAKAFPCKATK
jgi:hypothetical protein